MTASDPNLTNKTSSSEVLIHILAWGTRLLFILSILFTVVLVPDFSLLSQVFITTIVLLFVLIFLPDKRWTQIARWVNTDWKNRENRFARLLYKISIIFCWLIVISIGLGIILIFFPIVFSIFSQDPLIYTIVFSSAVILILILEWVMKFISK